MSKACPWQIIHIEESVKDMNVYKIRTILNIVFIIGAIASVVCYYAVEDRHVFIYVCSASIFVKLVEFMLRFLF